ncbi:DUF1152 domain-containing protein [Nocardia thailandica]
MRKAVMFAAGGGGDAVTAAMLARTLATDLTVTAVMSWSWDRLLLDPLPGPRTAADFTGLLHHGDGLHQVLPDATLTTGGASTLPRLAQHLAMPLLLADPHAGAVGLSCQLRRAAALFGADLIVVVDVGGDILAAGNEPGLRSPLADSLALAAAIISTVPTEVLVTGLGLDGELTHPELDQRLTTLHAREVATLAPRDAAGMDRVWQWHPSEANALLALATATGWTGTVESQRETTIPVDRRCLAVHHVDAKALTADSIAHSLLTSTSLDDVEHAVRARRGITDIDIERRRLASRPQPRLPDPDALAHLDHYAKTAADRGIDALTVRRVLELAAATDPQSSAALRQELQRQRNTNFRPPLYLTSP